MIDFVAMAAALIVVIVAVVLVCLNPLPGLPFISKIAAMGESETRKFKSPVRQNLHTGRHDEEMETIIAKTVPVFLNSGGGALPIGVDDESELVGFENDYSTLGSLDADRFGLWIHGIWGQRSGTNVAASPILGFTRAPLRGEVCRVTIPPSPHPVYPPESRGKGAPELWVRVGNSTRRLDVSDAALYVSQRWPEAVRVSLWMRLRTCFFLHKRERLAHLPRVAGKALCG